MRSLTRILATTLAAAIPMVGISAQSITDISADFQNSIPGANTSIGDWGVNGSQVCWPTAGLGSCGTLGTATNISGYRFVPTATPFGGLGSAFSLGTFTHFNYVVSLDAPGPLTSVDLLFSFEIAGATPGTFDDLWTVTHVETPNDADPCPEGGDQPCRDKVSFSIAGGSLTPFNIGGTNYILTIFGFGNSAEEAGLTPEFFTLENQANTTQLWARITEVPPTSTVPEPATMTLLATGLAGMAAARRRRKA